MNVLELMRRHKFVSMLFVLFTLTFGILIGTLINTGVKAEKGQAAPGATPLVIPSPVQMATEFTKLAKQLEPSVVNISTVYSAKSSKNSTRKRRTVDPDDEEGGDESMNDLFNRFFGGNPRMPGMPDQGQRRGSSVGSGVIVDKNGYILTNNHVVEKADRIRVKMAGDTTEYDAKLIGADQETDLAVIKIEANKQLSAAKVGNSDAVNVGDWAVAIGSPFGLQATVTAGIISAKERDITPGQSFQHFIQTDAAINPGNSGGPLLNIQGEVIGINTAIATQSGGYQGIGFALPINTAAKVYNQIIKQGRVSRGSIGISFQEARPELLKVYGAASGVFVGTVEPNGPSEKAGLKPKDVITAINGKPIKDGQDLINRVADTPVGQQLTLSILRDKQKQDLKVTVADRMDVFPERYRAARGDEPEQSEGTQARFGLTIENMTDARKDRLNFKEKGGVLVVRVEPDSFAEDIGVAANDVIVSINTQPVGSVDDVKRLQGALKPGDAVAFEVMRSGPARSGRGDRAVWQPVFLAGTLPNGR
jgi:serine protease Do